MTTSISVEGTDVFSGSSIDPLVPVSGHLLLVFKDLSGTEYVIRGGPSSNGESFGNLTLQTNILLDSSADRRGEGESAESRGNTTITFAGERDIASIWSILVQHAQNIELEQLPYSPTGFNSNGTVGNLLALVGIDIQDFLPNPEGIMLLPFSGRNVDFGFDFDIVGTETNDHLHGASGNQTFFGLTGDDRLFGGADDDTLVGGEGADIMDGGDGEDTVVFDYGIASPKTGFMNGVYVEWIGGAADAIDVYGGSDIILNVENVVGTKFNDYFKLTGEAALTLDQITALDAKNSEGELGQELDVIELAFDGGISVSNGLVFIGSTSAMIDGFEGIIGSNFADTIELNADSFFVNGAGGDDVISGGENDDFLVGGAGADAIDGGVGWDTVIVDPTSTAVTINAISGSGSGGDAAGDSFANIEAFGGTNSNDTFVSSNIDGIVYLSGGGGNDTFNIVLEDYNTPPMGQGVTIVFGGGGSDTYNVVSVAAGEEPDFGPVIFDVLLLNVIGLTDENWYQFNAYEVGAQLGFSLLDFDLVILNAELNDMVTADGEVLFGTVSGGGGAPPPPPTDDNPDPINDDLGPGGGEYDYGEALPTTGGEIVQSQPIADGSITVQLSPDGNSEFSFDDLTNLIETSAGGGSGGGTGGGGSGSGTGDVGSITGTVGDDLIDLSFTNDPDGDAITDAGQVINAGDGNDDIYDGAGDDSVYGGAGNDDFFAGAGADLYDGGTGNKDIVNYGNSAIGLTIDLTDTSNSTGIATGDTYANIDRIYGSDFDDVIIGDGSVGLLFGGDGDDDITDGIGKNYLRGGAGADTFRFVSDGDADRIYDFELGTDTLDVSAWGVTELFQLTFSESGTKLIIAFGAEEIVLDGLTSENGNFTVADFVFAEETGLSGDGTLSGTAGDDRIDIAYFGDVEGDTISDDGQLIIAGDGNDDIYDGAGDDSVFGGAGNDDFIAGAGADFYDGGTGNKDIVSYENSTVGLTIDLTDTSNSTGIATGDTYANIDRIYGTDLDDVIIGDGSIRFLGGGDGNDDITDADGKTYLHGGDGADVFRFVSDGDADRVHDFELGVDTLDVSAWGVTSLSELAFNTNGTKLVISFEDETIVLDRLAEENGNFTADDFIFV